MYNYSPGSQFAATRLDAVFAETPAVPVTVLGLLGIASLFPASAVPISIIGSLVSLFGDRRLYGHVVVQQHGYASHCHVCPRLPSAACACSRLTGAHDRSSVL